MRGVHGHVAGEVRGVHRHVAQLVRHVADDAEDDEAGEDAGDAVPDGDDDSVPVDVVVEVVVAGEGDHHAPRHADTEEYLRARRGPNLNILSIESIDDILITL